MPPKAPRILITRPANGNSELADRLRALGADPVLIPAIELTEPTSYAQLDAALERLDTFHWLLFTSANAVEAFAKRGTERKTDDRVTHSSTLSMSGESDLKTPKIAAIGPATARALEKIGLIPDLLPQQAVAESLTQILLPLATQQDGSPTRFLLIRAEEARELLPEALRAAGAEVTIAPAYRTIIPHSSSTQIQALFSQPPNRVPHLRDSSIVAKVGEAPQPPVAAITFTSSSTARNLLTLCEGAGVTLPPEALRISIGPITTAALHELGLPPHAEAPEATVRSLAETVMNALAHRPDPLD